MLVDRAEALGLVWFNEEAEGTSTARKWYFPK